MNRLDPKWTDELLKEMTDDEKVVDNDGKEYAKIAGLRRIARLKMGPIKSGKNGDPVAIAGGVSVTHTLMCYLRKDIIESESLPYETEEWSGSADCTKDNGGGAKDYATAFADTRAEARALVRLLGLSRCSAEEFDVKGSKNHKNNSVETESSVPANADIRMHEMLFKKLNIDKNKFYSVCGRTLFGKNWNVSMMNREEAMKLGEVLNDFQQNKEPIPLSILVGNDPF